MNDLLVRIKFQLPSLPRAEKIVAEELLENPEAIIDMTQRSEKHERTKRTTKFTTNISTKNYSHTTTEKEVFLMAKKKSFTDMLIKVFVDGSDKACKTVYVLVALFSIAVFASALALMLLPVTPDNLGLFQVIGTCSPFAKIGLMVTIIFMFFVAGK